MTNLEELHVEEFEKNNESNVRDLHPEMPYIVGATVLASIERGRRSYVEPESHIILGAE